MLVGRGVQEGDGGRGGEEVGPLRGGKVGDKQDLRLGRRWSSCRCECMVREVEIVT